VESVGTIDYQPDSSIEDFVTGIVYSEADCEDPGFVFADGLGDGDERFESAS
jgi:hypothetical protein